MSQTSRTMTKDSALSILNSRELITAGHIGQLVQTTIVGTGTIIPMTDKEGNQVYDKQGQPLFKVIYNAKLNSGIAQANERNKGILREAMAAFKAGDAEKGSEKINEYLNKVQVSFHVVLSSGQSAPFSGKEVVKGLVAMVTTENGSLLTLENVTAVQAVKAARTKVDSFEALLGEEAEGGEDPLAGA